MKTILLSSVSLAILLTSIPPASDAQWVQTNGPCGGTVRSFAILGTKVLAATYGGGVYCSSNDRKSWTAANSGLTNLSVNCLAVMGHDVFAGTDGGVLLSVDAGAHWKSRALQTVQL